MAPKTANPWNVMKAIYQNEFYWSVVKSFGMFMVGVRIAKEFVGVEIMPAIAQH